jgi:protein TonB
MGFSLLFLFKGLIEKIEPSPVKPEINNFFGSIVEEMPRFPGCEMIADKAERKSCSQRKMLEYVYNEIKYPAMAGCFEGTVVIRFYVNEKGEIEDTRILKDIGGGFGEEALRVVNTMKDLPERWIPGTQRGKKVKVAYNLPVKFRLE